MPAAPATRSAEPLNCIIDDSALLGGLKSRGDDNLARWVQEGLINLFVPLYSELCRRILIVAVF